MDRHGLVAYVRARHDGVVATRGLDGEPQAAYLPITATDDGDLLFDARASSRKVANLRRDPRVALVIGGQDGTTLQGEGLADEPRGEERERCATAYADAFPEFAESMSDPEIVLLRVRLTWARFGDFRRPGIPPVEVDLERRDVAGAAAR